MLFLLILRIIKGNIGNIIKHEEERVKQHTIDIPIQAIIDILIPFIRSIQTNENDQLTSHTEENEVLTTRTNENDDLNIRTEENLDLDIQLIENQDNSENNIQIGENLENEGIVSVITENTTRFINVRFLYDESNGLSYQLTEETAETIL
ncbi:putative SP-containing protein [Vairimorpha necatrix]|uniref:SP-containing protein n=1 Tax=Vairimorpha necatrix TaxID=6039 RepID=A0AAX4JG73_9MICR